MTIAATIEQHRTCAAAAPHAGQSKMLATLEDRMLQAAPVRGANNKLRWMQKQLGISQHIIACRRLVWNSDAADLLWPLLDTGALTADGGRRVLAEARKLGRKGDALRQAVTDILNGTHRLPPTREVAELAEPDPSADPRIFWQQMRATVSAYAKPLLELVPEHDREQMLDDFARDLQAMFRQHQTKWQRTAVALSNQRRVSRQRFNNALRALHMDPPRRNSPLGPILTQANRQKRSLARLYHPDSHGGNEQTRPQYQAVIEAFLIVERYVEENKQPSVPNLRLVGGGKT